MLSPSFFLFLSSRADHFSTVYSATTTSRCWIAVDHLNQSRPSVSPSPNLSASVRIFLLPSPSMQTDCAPFPFPARCNGLTAKVTSPLLDCPATKRAEGLAKFRVDLKVAAQGRGAMAISYDRRTLGQTGSGHFSPVGGYNEGEDKLLILDVARCVAFLFSLPVLSRPETDVGSEQLQVQLSLGAGGDGLRCDAPPRQGDGSSSRLRSSRGCWERAGIAVGSPFSHFLDAQQGAPHQLSPYSFTPRD